MSTEDHPGTSLIIDSPNDRSPMSHNLSLHILFVPLHVNSFMRLNSPGPFICHILLHFAYRPMLGFARKPKIQEIFEFQTN